MQLVLLYLYIEIDVICNHSYLFEQCKSVSHNRLISLRFITTEELEQALREFGMHDGRDIKEILSEVDADNVSNVKKSFMQR